MSQPKETLLKLLEAVSYKVIASEKTLTDLDAAIGDGDCGASLRKGFEKVLERLPSLQTHTLGGILSQVGMTIMSSVGGVSGAIYATAFLRAGRNVGAKDSLTLEDVHQALVAAMEGVKERGEGTKVGDKTLVDSLEPAVQVFGQAVAAGDSAKPAVEKALAAAKTGSDSTIPLIARKGRASYLGERSAGHRDPGSVVICLMWEAARDSLS
jgi:dihydroxyacetone kinase-like protein